MSEDEPEPIPVKKVKQVTFQNLTENSSKTDIVETEKVGAEPNQVPFPSALTNPDNKKVVNKRGPQQEEIWEVFRQVKINLPLIDAIKQVPAYAKYLKDMCTQKRQHKFPKKLDLTECVSAVLTGELPPKLQDPGTPLIPIQVGEFKMTRALLDLGASVSILPGSLYDQYDFGPLHHADTTVVLADLTLKLPRGIVRDVIVKVEDFYYLVDFLVLDCVSFDMLKQPNVILGRPFLATAHALIDCCSGTVDMAFGNRKVRLNVFSNVSNSLVSDECFMADIIDRCHPHLEGETTEFCFICDRLPVTLLVNIKNLLNDLPHCLIAICHVMCGGRWSWCGAGLRWSDEGLGGGVRHQWSCGGVNIKRRGRGRKGANPHNVEVLGSNLAGCNLMDIQVKERIKALFPGFHPVPAHQS
ncbi:hypothetical protein E3N88_10066 [Mikania micrantha]|uniref:Aspartic peptidase DDI1-type domain-containing protein n=1 Tax=Mikania micrantha TaxID=192012 RepID=A0A5N6P9M1_9ASTR|nr:hypothetical protein E3N88_10066 [Mikania micrantha]